MPKKQSIPHFENYKSLMEECVLPFLQKHPDFECLNEQSDLDNRTSFATFEHQGHKWKIDIDTKTDQLLAAWNLFLAGKEPFVQSITDKGKRCLRLNEGALIKANGLYIYGV